ncbi:hypothetical protein G4Y79_14545 [Phototrophicus methaneseepsis]|uniref:Uncharacterized protein n=1 Tax=Phototrophicus methaneseepsis TaxID=2710758 RepID=A0A7S8IBX1_9CHLR|nr:hypothetical protein [Phototrophicus methaneseepsis]QPC80925.1 hypothetical protein G4Y79_14545 [Phototrophicus methaneseepsis]
MPNSGKKTLLNSLWDWDAVEESSESVRNYGLFTLIDLSADAYDVASIMYRLENAELVVYVLDCAQGLTPESYNWIARLRSLDTTLLVILSRADELPKAALKSRLETLEKKLARPILPIVANDKQAVQGDFVKSVLRLCPDLSAPLASEIPALRSAVARRMVIQAVMTSLQAVSDGSELSLTHDLKQVQANLIREIAGIYGYRGMSRVRERFFLSLFIRWITNQGIPQLESVPYTKSWMRSGGFSAALTFAIGYLTIFAYGATLPNWMNVFTPQAWRTHHGKVDKD